MSSSNLGHESIKKDQSITDEKGVIRKSTEMVSQPRRDRESVIPFAKDMVHNVVTGALSILDISRKEGKPWKDVLATEKSSSETLCSRDAHANATDCVDLLSEVNQTSQSPLTSDAQRPIVQVMHLQVRDDVVFDSAHAEQVANIVKGLQNIQIGDSAYVLPAGGSNIEKQVERAVQNITSLQFGDLETAQLIICDGQGDVDDQILNAKMGPPSIADSKPQHDASRISRCVLHKMIEELEDSDSTNEKLPDHQNREGIARWEESEEQFVRLIDGPDDERGSGAVENQDDHHPVMFDEESVELGADHDEANRNVLLANSLGHGQQALVEEVTFPEWNNRSQSRDILDNHTDEEPYWCTAGLITRVVKPQNDEFISNEDCGTSSPERNLEIKRTETSVCESLGRHAEGNSNILQHQESAVKGKKKKSLGKRLTRFFSRLTRTGKLKKSEDS